MAAGPADGSPARRRTRQAIIEAAIATWVRNRDATLDEIARAAEAHRATLHRHFASRAELLDAAVDRCVADIRVATEQAAVHDGAPLDALRRIVASYLAIGDRIRFLFDDLALARHPAVVELAADDEAVLALVERARDEGVVDPALPPAWVERSIWALVYTASEALDEGKLAPHEALAVLLRTIERGIGA